MTLAGPLLLLLPTEGRRISAGWTVGRREVVESEHETIEEGIG
jgi:hypothetical protein